MTFRHVVRQILHSHPEGLTPQQLREIVKSSYPNYYGTESHTRNVEKGHYQDLDHALLAHIYVIAKNDACIDVDRGFKPLKIKLSSLNEDSAAVLGEDQEIDNESLDKLESGKGTIYVLGTNLYTKDGEEIIKIGITTGSVEARIHQLYTTGVPLRPRIIDTHETKNYNEAEQAIHKLLAPYRINQSREFFTQKCLPFVKQILSVHEDIQKAG